LTPGGIGGSAFRIGVANLSSNSVSECIYANYAVALKHAWRMIFPTFAPAFEIETRR
jgi:hypothetical protein